MAVTPLRDGMNLVAKEYVATRLDDTGVLLLSEFTGAADEMRSAMLVNPYDVDGLAGAMRAALELPVDQQKHSMRELRRVLRKRTVFDWAESFLGVLLS
jgi:trehalose 6-phosphate synthase